MYFWKIALAGAVFAGYLIGSISMGGYPHNTDVCIFVKKLLSTNIN